MAFRPYQVDVLLRPIQTKAPGLSMSGAVCPDSAGSAGSRRQRAGSLLRQAGVFRSPSRAIPAIERRGPVPRAGFLKFNQDAFSMQQTDLKKDPQAAPFFRLSSGIPRHGWCRHSQRHARVDHRERASANPGRPQARIDGRLQFLEQDIEGKRASYQATSEARSPGCWKRTASGGPAWRMSSGVARAAEDGARFAYPAAQRGWSRSPPGWGSSADDPGRTGRGRAGCRAAFSAPR